MADLVLEEIRKLAAMILNHEEYSFADVNRLAELVQVLDAFLESGGKLPQAWAKNGSTA